MILPRFIENLHQNPNRTRGFQSGLASIPYSDQSETSIDLAAAAYLMLVSTKSKHLSEIQRSASSSALQLVFV